jgi:hypothetical protein
MHSVCLPFFRARLGSARPDGHCTLLECRFASTPLCVPRVGTDHVQTRSSPGRISTCWVRGGDRLGTARIDSLYKFGNDVTSEVPLLQGI